MKYTLLAAITSALSFSSLAVTDQLDNTNHFGISNNTCDIQFNNKLTITPNSLSIEAQPGLMTIKQDGRLLINNKPQSVSSNEQDRLAEYSSSIRESLPQVVDVALEGVAIAGVALKEVGEAFEIDNTDAMEDFMSDISDKIQSSFYGDGSFIVDQGRFTTLNNTFDSEFDQQLEEIMEDMVMDSVGSLLMSIGSGMKTSGSDMADFENRMEKMSEQIEEKVTLESEKLEYKVIQLCDDMRQLVELEKQLQTDIPELKNFDLFTLEG